jgi:hypothetical protein
LSSSWRTLKKCCRILRKSTFWLKTQNDGRLYREQLKLSIAHKLMADFFTYCTPAQKLQMIETIKERLPEICYTQDGANVAMECIWNSDAKDRKVCICNVRITYPGTFRWLSKASKDCPWNARMINLLDVFCMHCSIQLTIRCFWTKRSQRSWLIILQMWSSRNGEIFRCIT